MFHSETGFRIAKQRSPTPSDIPPPAVLVNTGEVREILANGGIAIDVFGAQQSRYDELDGTWLVSKKRRSLPGAIWLPEVGRGSLGQVINDYLVSNLEKITGGVLDKPLVIFCIADCWMSWNASQRIANLGYRKIFWYRLGTDGWEEEGYELEIATPVPVNVD